MVHPGDVFDDVSQQCDLHLDLIFNMAIPASGMYSNFIMTRCVCEYVTRIEIHLTILSAWNRFYAEAG